MAIVFAEARALSYYNPALITKGRTTIASYLKSRGSRTAGFGKWHLGLDWTPVAGDPAKWRSHWHTRETQVALRVQKGIDHTKPFKNSPIDIGFDTYFGTPSNCTRLPFFIQDNRVFGQPKPDSKKQLRDPACARDKVDDLYVAKALAFMEAHLKNHPNNPFFVYLPLNAIHGAVNVPKRFAGQSKMSNREDKIFWADESVGKILAALDRMKLRDDTLVIFTTDNGPINGPLARKNGQAPDSWNMLPVLLQKKNEIIEHSALVTASYGGFLTIRQGDWKAVFGTKWTGGHPAKTYSGPSPKGTPPDDPGIGQLYKISVDPFEKQDLWQSHPEVAKTLRRKLQTIKEKDKPDAFRL